MQQVVCTWEIILEQQPIGCACKKNTIAFFVADLHALTTDHDPKALNHHTKTILAHYLGLGLDPEKCTLYIQSDVPEIIELYLVLNMFANKGELEKTASFKEKARKKGNH